MADLEPIARPANAGRAAAPKAVRSAIEHDVRPRVRPFFRVLFFGFVLPVAVLMLLGIGYLVFVLGVEHY